MHYKFKNNCVDKNYQEWGYMESRYPKDSHTYGVEGREQVYSHKTMQLVAKIDGSFVQAGNGDIFTLPEQH